ncbi:MAG TPA: DUF4386 family protein [Thermoanaerobaculia bacterium]|nr:DUF4386 family protein [Thermoanaerobaculia bacterium]
MNTEVPTRHATIIRIGGLSLILGAAAFMGVFSWLASEFNYPEVLDGRAADVLPALLATGATGRAVWALYALLPLFWIPASIGAFHALRAKSEGAMRAGMYFAALSSLTMILGLMRWPSFHWELARAWVADPSLRPALDTLFNAANLYLGNYIGEFLGELCISLFFLLAAVAMLPRDSGFPRWIALLGLTTAIAGLLGMFRNVTGAVAPIAEVNNYLLPLWMIVFGTSLLRFAKKPAAMAVSPAPAAA